MNKHPYHCMLCGAQLSEIGLGFLSCKCGRQYLPFLDKSTGSPCIMLCVEASILPTSPAHICECGLPYDNPIALWTGDSWWLGWDCKDECGETDEYSMEWPFAVNKVTVNDLESYGFTVY